jgi:hypothetical protein
MWPIVPKVRDVRAPGRTNRGGVEFFFRTQETLADKDDASDFTVSGSPRGISSVLRSQALKPSAIRVGR